MARPRCGARVCCCLRGLTYWDRLNGDSGVGKSSLILRFLEDQFSEDQVVSIGEDFKEKTVSVDGRSVRLQLWDTVGQERYRIITSSFYKNAQGILIVYDVSNKESVDNVERWSREVDRYLEDSGVKVVVGNKTDLGSPLSTDAAAEVCDNIGAQHFLASAKTGKGVTEMFEGLVRELLAQADRAVPEPAGEALVTQASPAGERTGCCVVL